MDIRQRIRSLIDSPTAVFHDAAGEPVPADRARAEYRGIREYVGLHVRPGDIAAIHLDHGYRYLLAILACMDLGVPYLPLRRGWPAARIAQIQRLSEFGFVLNEDNIHEVCSCSGSGAGADSALSPDAILYVICTSGTTGEPKGVMIQRRAYEHFLHWVEVAIPGGPDCKILFVADFTFDMSLLDVALFLANKCHCYFSRFNGNLFRLAHEIDIHEISSLATVPNNINLLLQDDLSERCNLQSLTQLLLGGSRFSYGTWSTLFKKLPGVKTVLNLYGPTGATVYCHCKRLRGSEADEVIDANVSIGKPIPGLKCRLLDDELLIGGVQVMAGYLGDPERTAQSLVRIDGETYYRTGDLAFVSATGDYFITGRKDETLKRRGYRVNLLDIDSYIQKIDAVQDCATVAIPDADADHILVTFIIPRNRLPETAMRQAIAQRLVDYQVPDSIVYVDRFPTNNSGKVCKVTLKKSLTASGRSA